MPFPPALTEAQRACVAFGGNVGDVEANLRSALKRVAALPATRILRISSLYRTAPVGLEDQPDFINGALLLHTGLPPLQLLRSLLEIERALGRTRDVRWGPRTVDLDLILYGDRIIAEPELEVPHPRMHERAFVLVPLAEVALTMLHPLLGMTVSQLLDRLDETSGIERLHRPVWMDSLQSEDIG